MNIFRLKKILNEYNFKTVNNNDGSEYKKGFTLIELLVVVSIIGLLATIVMAGLNASREKARNSKRIQLTRQYVNALELYRNNNSDNLYPSQGDKNFACIGYGEGEFCMGSAVYDGDSGFNNALGQYIPGPPANTDSVMAGIYDLKGTYYRCLNGCRDFELSWVNEGPDTNCGIGYFYNDSYGGNVLCKFDTL